MSMHFFVYALFLVTCLSRSIWAQEDAKCETVGIQCSKDNKTIVACQSIGSDPQTIEECSEDSVCKQENNNIVCHDPRNIKLTFVCTGKGEFPDPVDCDQTYICQDADQEPSDVCKCPSGNNVYPSPGLFCMSGDCPRNNITCTEGANGPITLKSGQETSYYYYCGSSNTIKVFDNYKGSDGKALYKLWPSFRWNQGGKECEPYNKDGTSTEAPTTATSEPNTSTESTSTASTSSEPTDPTNTASTPSGSTDPTNTASTPSGSTDPTNTASTPSGSTDPTNTGSTASGSTDPTNTGSTASGSTDPTNTGSTASGSTDPTNTASTPSESTDPTNTASTASGSTETTMSTPTTVQVEEKPTCKTKGELYPTECDCDYYKCDSNLKPARRTCADGLRYNERLAKCVFGECDKSKCIHRPSSYIF